MSNLDTAKKAAGLLEAKDLKGLQTIMADDFSAKGSTLELTKQQVLGYLQIMFTAFPDHRFGFADFEAKGDSIYCTSRETGTHTGILDLNPLGMPVSLPQTGKSFKMPKRVITFRVAGDKLTYYGEEDVAGGGLKDMLAQLGVNVP
jgi:predicted ester cyclase